MPTLAGAAATVLLLLLGFASSGCGANATSGQRSRSSSRPAKLPDAAVTAGAQTSGVSASVMFLGTGKPRPVHDLYAVFRRPSTAADIAVEAIARADGLEEGDEGAGPPGSSLGQPLSSQTRLLFGTKAHGVYAVPTTEDVVCIGNFPDGGGGCGEPGPHGLTVDYEDASGPTPFLLYGLVGDDVESLDFVFSDGAVRHAEVRENGYFVQMPGRRQGGPDRFILRLRNGATDVLPSGGDVSMSSIVAPVPNP